MSSRKSMNSYDNLCSGFQNLSVASAPKKVWYKNLHPSTDLYDDIANLVDCNESIMIENIVKVHNPRLEKAYLAKKYEKVCQFGHVNEELLFHGTTKNNVENICTNNFNWRLYGTKVGHKFGKGVNFSPSAEYASTYSTDDYNKVMIIAKVIHTDVCMGHKNMKYPPFGFDASRNARGTVLVKYDDNEYYPAYKLYYHFEDEDDSEEDDSGDYEDEDDYYY